MAQQLRSLNIRSGLALLANTTLDSVKELVDEFDHLLIFAGKLGFQGGEFDETMLEKVQAARELWPELEIAADGGVGEHNAAKIVQAGATVLDCGGYFKDAPQPKTAYERLLKLAEVA